MIASGDAADGPSSLDAGRVVHLAASLDDKMAMPAAAMVRSALDAFREGWRLELHLLAPRISNANRARIEKSWGDAPLDVHWLRPDLRRLAGLPPWGPGGMATYYRLLLPELAPASLGKILYLDADMIVRRDLAALWEEELGDALCLAAQDLGLPHFDLDALPKRLREAPRALPRVSPIPSWRELGLDGAAPYFNAGATLMNLDLWRKESTSDAALDVLRRRPELLPLADQNAMNVVCHGRWRAVDLRWNRLSAVLDLGAKVPGDPFLTLPLRTQLAHDPWIIHYAGGPKPWESIYQRSDRDDFFEAVDRTDWAGWRPRRTWAHWWLRRTSALQRLRGRFLADAAVPKRPAA